MGSGPWISSKRMAGFYPRSMATPNPRGPNLRRASGHHERVCGTMGYMKGKS